MEGRPPDSRDGSGNRGRVLVAVGVGLVVLLAIGSGSGAFAGDQPTVIYSAEETYTVEQGETLAIDVYVSSDGGVGDVGVEEVQLVAAYDETLLTAVDAEAAAWLAGGESTDVETDVAVDEDSGRLTVDQRRNPPGDGVTGNELFATLTFEVQDGTEPGNTTIAFGDSDVRLTDQYPVPVFDEEATVTVREDSGGGGLSPPVVVGGVAAAGALLVLGAIGARRL